MRDGTVLRADVYLPESAAPVPALLTRTPYERSRAVIANAAIDLDRATEAGFAIVVQDVRGRGASDGAFRPFVHERDDTYDTVEWMAAEPWCSGNVGMVGRSYPAAIQWAGAVSQPPHLRAIVPVVVGSETYESAVYQGGAFLLGFNLFWVRLLVEPGRTGKLDEWYRHLPLGSIPELVENPAAAFYADWLAHPQWSEYWAANSVNQHYGRVAVPACLVGGWYDIFLKGTLENFCRLQTEASTEESRAGQRLVIGPWAHGAAPGEYPDHRFPDIGDAGDIDLNALQLRFFQQHLCGSAAPLWEGEEERPVRLFVMGANRWRDEAAWPLARAQMTPWFLREGGQLTPSQPGDDEPSSRFVYDPADPTPTVGGPTALPGPMLRTDQGPRDQRPLESRTDVVVFTSEPLTEPVEVTGPLSAVIHFATSAPDSDVVVKLCDVWPDGRSMVLAEGIQRCRFRMGRDHEVPMVPGRPEPITVDLVATSNQFGRDHCIRVDVTSASFPRFDRNPNSGKPFATDGPGDLRVAQQTVFHDAARPSHIVLPIVR